MTGDLLIRWTIRLSMASYALYLGRWILPGGADRDRLLRGLWSSGCVLCGLHFVAAFQYAHHWSHEHAVADTARQTQEMLGWAFGEGIYFSYLFLAIWILDTIWWWIRPIAYAHRPRWLSYLVHAYILFIAINGTMVFEDGVTRWAGLGVGVSLAVAAAFTRSRMGRSPAGRSDWNGHAHD